MSAFRDGEAFAFVVKDRGLQVQDEKRRPPADKWATSEMPHIVDHFAMRRVISSARTHIGKSFYITMVCGRGADGSNPALNAAVLDSID